MTRKTFLRALLPIALASLAVPAFAADTTADLTIQGTLPNTRPELQLRGALPGPQAGRGRQLHRHGHRHRRLQLIPIGCPDAPGLPRGLFVSETMSRYGLTEWYSDLA